MTGSASGAAPLPPFWARLARLVWLLVAGAALLLFAIGAPRYLRQPFVDCGAPGALCDVYTVSQADAQVAAGLSLPVPALTLLAISGVWLARWGLAAVGVIIFSRRRDDGVAYLLSLSLVTVLIEGGFPDMGPLKPAVDALFALGFLCYMPLPFIFPNGRFQPRWMGWVAMPLTLLLFFSQPNPLVVIPALNVLWLPWIALAGFAVIYRYLRGASALERQQLKWLGLALMMPFISTLSTVPLTAFYLPSGHSSPVRLALLGLNELLYALGYLISGACIAIAILRYRLWDIDLIIRRTLLYSALTALLAVVYFGSVVVLQNVFIVLTGGARSELVTVLSTLAIAALFVPLRGRLQGFIDRRFYRRKYDAARTLAEFAASLRDEVDLEDLSEQLLTVVTDAMQPEAVHLVLVKPAEAPMIAGRAP